MFSHYGLSTIAVAIICWLTVTASRAELADSGWVIGRPSTDAAQLEARDPAAHFVIDHILQQTRVPLLQTPSPTAKSQGATPRSDGNPRVAKKVLGIDGWRAADEAASTDVDAEAHGVLPAAQSVSPSDIAHETGADTPREGAVEFRAPQVDALPLIRFGSASSVGAAATGAPEADEPSPRAVLSTIERAPAAAADILDAAESANISDALGPVDLTITDASTNESLAPEESDGDDGASDRSFRDAPADGPSDVATDDEMSGLDRGRGLRRAQPSGRPGSLLDQEQEQSSALPPLTRQLMNLRTKVRSVLKGYSRKSLNSRENDPWEVMHGMLAYELHSKIHQGGPRGELITSVGWLCYNKPCKNLTLMYVTPEGELRAKQGVGLQGHKGQLLAMLAQSRVSPSYPIRVGKHHFTIDDLIEAEKKTCYPKTELTFKLIAFTHYLDLDAKWVNDEGLDWDIPRLIREELAQPIRGAACGGTHRLSGLTLAVKARARRGEPIDGEYLRAAEYVEKYENYAFRLQNRDGSLSTRWFQGRGDEDDEDRRVKTTGHILEWLVYSLSDEELREQRTIRAVNYLASVLYSNYDHEWEIGPRSHALHALLRYDERVFRPYDGVEGVAASKSNQPSARRAGRSSWR